MSERGALALEQVQQAVDGLAVVRLAQGDRCGQLLDLPLQAPEPAAGLCQSEGSPLEFLELAIQLAQTFGSSARAFAGTAGPGPDEFLAPCRIGAEALGSIRRDLGLFEQVLQEPRP